MGTSSALATLLLRATFGDVDALLASPLTLRLATAVSDSEFTEVEGSEGVPLVLGTNIALSTTGTLRITNTEPLTFENLPTCTVTHTVLTGISKQIITPVSPLSVTNGGTITIPAGALTVQIV